MAIPTVAVGGKVTAVETNLLVAATNQIALQGIIPSSVVGGAATANGSVSCTNATRVSLNGVFSGTYDNYRIFWNVATRSASSSLVWQLRQAGTDVTSAVYNWSRGYDSGTTRTVTSGTATTSLPCDFGLSATMTSDGYMDLSGPALGSYTAAGGIASLWSGTAAAALTTSGYVSLGTASDGISFSLTSGTFSGTFRVYGYNNLT